MSCISAQDSQLTRLAEAIAQRVGQQRFHVWFSNSTRLDLRNDGLEIAVPNDFISEWIGTHFSRPIQEAANEVLGCDLQLKFNVSPELFEMKSAFGASKNPTSLPGTTAKTGATAATTPAGVFASTRAGVAKSAPPVRPTADSQQKAPTDRSANAGTDRENHFGAFSTRSRLRHDLHTFITGPSNQLAAGTTAYVAEFPGAQYNPLFIHGSCGLGKTHLLQGLCRKFIAHHPTKRWMYLTGEEFTNEYLTALRGNKLDAFRRKMRDLDLLVIDDVHFLSGKRATQEEFLHTFNSIEAMGKQVVMASDSHPKVIEAFGESLINRFVSGMVVRIDPPNFATRCEILRALALRSKIVLPEEVVNWVGRRVTKNVRELEGAMTRISALSKLCDGQVDAQMAQDALGDLDRQHAAPVRPEAIVQSVCTYFGLEQKDLMSGCRQRTISLARSLAMYMVRKTARLSFPEIGARLGKRNHSTVISACRRIERAVSKNESLAWTSAVGERQEEATELIERLEEQCRSLQM